MLLVDIMALSVAQVTLKHSVFHYKSYGYKLVPGRYWADQGMSEINLVAITVVVSLVGLVVGLIIWRNWRDRESDKDHAGLNENNAHQKQKPMNRPDVRS